MTCSAARLAPEGSRCPSPQLGSKAVGMPRLLEDLRGSRELFSPHQVTGQVLRATQGPEGGPPIPTGKEDKETQQGNEGGG